MKRLKDKWGIKSNFQLLLILVVFAITGFIAAFIAADPLLLLFNINSGDIYYWPVRILIIFPIYQVLILCVGFLFGQFDFFWKFEKKLLYRIGFKKFKN